MLCDDCKERPATIKVIAVMEGMRIERNLCQDCLAKHRAQLKAASIQGKLSALFRNDGDKTEKKPTPTCPACGTAYSTFLKTNRLGCGQCYAAFRTQLEPLLIRLHGKAQHQGRRPEPEAMAMDILGSMEALRLEMDMAIACEDFERAAALRDQIKALAANRAGGGPDA